MIRKISATWGIAIELLTPAYRLEGAAVADKAQREPRAVAKKNAAAC